MYRYVRSVRNETKSNYIYRKVGILYFAPVSPGNAITGPTPNAADASIVSIVVA